MVAAPAAAVGLQQWAEAVQTQLLIICDVVLLAISRIQTQCLFIFVHSPCLVSVLLSTPSSMSSGVACGGHAAPCFYKHFEGVARDGLIKRCVICKKSLVVGLQVGSLILYLRYLMSVSELETARFPGEPACWHQETATPE
jgi:hypothetical protein